MKCLGVCSFVAGVVFLWSCGTVSAQVNKQTGVVWKKQVAREVEIKSGDEKVHHLRDLSRDTTFLELIVNAVSAGKITAYSNWDHRFSTKLTIKEFNEMLVSRPDTQMIVDPITRKEKTVIITHDLDFEAIHKYRILEDWSFNRATGNTDVHIEGIAPIKEIFGEDGSFRGVQAMFWVKYNDLAAIMQHYEQYHPDKTIPALIWNDYFLSDVKPGEKK